LGIPITNSKDEVIYETKPTQYCPDHPAEDTAPQVDPKDSAIFDIWDFLNNNED